MSDLEFDKADRVVDPKEGPVANLSYWERRD